MLHRVAYLKCMNLSGGQGLAPDPLSKNTIPFSALRTSHFPSVFMQNVTTVTMALSCTLSERVIGLIWLRIGCYSIPFDADCCHMGTAIAHFVPDRVKPSFVILTSGHSDAQDALWLYPYGISGCRRVTHDLYSVLSLRVVQLDFATTF